MRFTIDNKRLIKWIMDMNEKKLRRKRLLKMFLTEGEVLMG